MDFGRINATAPSSQATHKLALAYGILFLALTFPYWLQGQVISPFRPDTFIGAPHSASPYVENVKFTDFWLSFIPEIDLHLHAPRSGWIALWDKQNELGRPLSHLSGFSPAYAPTWLISKIIADPLRLVTLLSLAWCFLGGLFVLLACCELGLLASASLTAAAAFAACPLFMYWLPFTTFSATWCWSAGVLYAATRLSTRADLVACSALAFSAYSLLLTAYPQIVVYHGYILSGCAGWLALRVWNKKGFAKAAGFIAAGALSMAFGAALAAPVLADVMVTAANSARSSPDVNFFTDILPRIDSVQSAFAFLSVLFSHEFFGNPNAASYPFEYYGLSVTPLVTFLGIYSLLANWRRTWGWWAAIAALVLLTFSRPMFAFAVSHLGFNLSRSLPLGSVLLPMTMISAFAADHLMRKGLTDSRSRICLLAALCTTVLLLFVLSAALATGHAVRWLSVIGAAIVLAFIFAQVRKPRPALLVFAAVVTGAYISFPLMLRDDISSLRRDSPVLDALRKNLPDGARLATQAPGTSILPPNLNAYFDLGSLHSYNSLSSRRYQSLIAAMNGNLQAYGRWNSMVSPDYASDLFWMSDIGLVLTPEPLSDARLAYRDKVGGLFLYRVESRMGCCLQIFSGSATGAIEATQLRNSQTFVPSKTRDEGDILELDVQSGSASLLLLSQQFDHRWFAKALTKSGWQGVATVPVNGVFQGVDLPEGSTKVRLRYFSSVRFSWIGNVIWLLVLVALIGQYLILGNGPLARFATRRRSDDPARSSF